MFKKLLAATAITTAFMLPGFASADCSITTCANGPDPMSHMMSWGLTGFQTPRIASGATVTDTFGRSYTCPIWFPEHMGCFDLTGTAWYLAQFTR